MYSEKSRFNLCLKYYFMIVRVCDLRNNLVSIAFTYVTYMYVPTTLICLFIFDIILASKFLCIWIHHYLLVLIFFSGIWTITCFRRCLLEPLTTCLSWWTLKCLIIPGIAIVTPFTYLRTFFYNIENIIIFMF